MTPEEQAEEQYQSLLKKRLDTLRQQQRMQRDIADAMRREAATGRNPLLEAQQRMAALREERAMVRERAQADQQARLHDLRQRFGMAGQMYGRMEQAGQSRFAKVAGAGLTAFGAAAGGMARSGFSGTVEQNAFDYEMKMLAREMAGAFKPVMDLMTRGANSVRRFMEGLDEAGQNLVMFAGLAGGAMGIRAIGMRGLGMLAGGGMMGGMMGGGGAAAAAAGSGAMNMAALAGASAMPVAGAGAAGMGSRLMGGARGLAGRGLGLAGRASPWMAVAGLGLAASGYGAQHADQSNPYSYTFGEQNPEMAAMLAGLSPAERIRLMKQADEEKPNAALRGLGSIGKAGRNWGAWALNQIPVGERIKYIDESSSADQLKRELQRRGDIGPDGRRSVTPAGAAYEEVGSAYGRASLSFLNTTAYEQANRETGPMGNPVATAEETAAGLKKIAEILERMEQQTAPNKQVQ